MLEWCNSDYSDGDKLVDVIHKFKPTVSRVTVVNVTHKVFSCCVDCVLCIYCAVASVCCVWLT
jgi:hypothetical protein